MPIRRQEKKDKHAHSKSVAFNVKSHPNIAKINFITIKPFLQTPNPAKTISFTYINFKWCKIQNVKH